MTRHLSVLLLMLLTSAGCSQTSDKPAAENSTPAAEASADLNLCIDPRPEICTQNYAPVCGVHEDGSRKTYSNGCSACSNPDVVGTLPEACPE